jgi:hypothetical protein
VEKIVEKVYFLGWSTDHIKGSHSGIRLLNFSESDNDIERLMNVEPYNLPESIIFRTDFRFLSQTDYPPQQLNWPIMSRRMYYTLLAVKDFPHRVIPLVMESTRLDVSQPNYRTIDSDNFVVIQFLEHANYFNYELSECSLEEQYPQRYVLNEPPEGFPPLFRLSVNPKAIFISAEAREALKEAGIVGTAYSPASQVERPQEVDLPIPIIGVPGSTFEMSFNGRYRFLNPELAQAAAEKFFNSEDVKMSAEDIHIYESFLIIHKSPNGNVDDWYAYIKTLGDVSDTSLVTYISCENEIESDDCGIIQANNFITDIKFPPDVEKLLCAVFTHGNIEPLRDQVREEDLPYYVQVYWRLDWYEKAFLINLIWDSINNPVLQPLMRDILDAPVSKEKDDTIRFAQAVALAYYADERDKNDELVVNFDRFDFSNPQVIQQLVNEQLSRL